MESECLSEFDGLLRHLVRRFMQKNKAKITSHVSSTEDDLMQDVRLAAQMAIEKYDHTKNTKIETWIQACVQTRLMDIARYESVRPEYIFPETLEIESFIINPEDSMNFDISMRSLLTAKEYKYYRLEFLEGHSQREIVSLKLFTEREVQCLRRRILSKFASSEKNLDQHLTQKRLQESWLNNFQS